MYPINSPQRARRQGFTLTELLVSLTISVAVLGAVFVAFNASNRAIRQGYMTVRGFDLARGTFDILESDLSTAFTQRELGDNYKFFGTPVGFTYIGTSNPATGAGAANVPQIARVTYVVYFGNPLSPGSGERGSGSVIIQEAYDGYQDGEAREGGFFFNQEVVTYSLLRFVEPGVSDLDSWPSIGGSNLWDVLAGGPEATNQLIADYLAEPIVGAPVELDYIYSDRDALDAAVNRPRRRADAPTPEQQLLQEARKRELWIRMLAGDPRLPNLWQLLGRNPRDFVVAENIYLPTSIVPLVPEFTDERFVFFRYGVSQRLPMQVDGAGNIIPAGGLVFDGERHRTTTEFRLRDGQPNERWHIYWSSAYNLLHSPNIDGDNPRRFDPIPATPRLSGREVFGWLTNEQGFPLVDSFGAPVPDPFLGQAVYNSNLLPGTPYDSQLPEQIHMRFEYLLESPWAGVAEFKREFDQVVDVPTGYTRKPPPTVAGL